MRRKEKERERVSRKRDESERDTLCVRTTLTVNSHTSRTEISLSL
jgi:hypothetical protein